MIFWSVLKKLHYRTCFSPVFPTDYVWILSFLFVFSRYYIYAEEPQFYTLLLINTYIRFDIIAIIIISLSLSSYHRYHYHLNIRVINVNIITTTKIIFHFLVIYVTFTMKIFIVKHFFHVIARTTYQINLIP